MAFQRVATLDELWVGDMVRRMIGTRPVLLVRLGDDSVHAYEDKCAHLGVALSEGRLEGNVITCSAHQYQYDACSGRGVNPTDVCLRAYPVKLEAGAIFVDVDVDLDPRVTP